jgi:thiamine-phosphate diphosphorylase
VTDDAYDTGNLSALVAAAIEGGTTCVQLRLKDCNTRRLLELGQELQPLCRAAGVPFLVDDRVDVALALDADGVHVGQSDLPPALVRQLIGPDKVLGVTLDLADESSIAEAVLPPANADYLGSNAVFPTSTKDTAVYGLEGLRRAKELIADAAASVGRPPIPLVAIGGVKLSNGKACLDAGADGLAVVSAILGGGGSDGEHQQEAAREASAALRRLS